MHQNISMSVRMAGQLGNTFPAELGVKQGDPLSPLLFGLFIDRIENYMRQCCPNQGVSRDGLSILQLLLYADDLVLLAESEEQLQQLLNCLHSFCVANLMTVNTNKSQVVVFNGVRDRDYNFIYNGIKMPDGPSYVYLGVKFEGEKCDINCNSKIRIDKAKAALHALFTSCHCAGIYNAKITHTLFTALVASVCNYACEVWGAYQLSSLDSKGWGSTYPAEELQKTLLRRVLQVPKSTTIAVMMDELSAVPLAFSWLKQSLGWWNRICLRNNSDIVRWACMDSIQLSNNGHASWAHHMSTALGQLCNANQNLSCKVLQSKPMQ
jgi:hypothetical protein